MSDTSQTATPPVAAAGEPKLCKMGCGFFGNGATNGCCSKCWRELQKKSEAAVVAAPKPVVEQRTEPMETEPVSPVKAVAAPAAQSIKKKKKKKTSYRDMMAGMLQAEERDVEKEKESLRKVTGGGVFSKIDKI